MNPRVQTRKMTYVYCSKFVRERIYDRFKDKGETNDMLLSKIMDSLEEIETISKTHGYNNILDILQSIKRSNELINPDIILEFIKNNPIPVTIFIICDELKIDYMKCWKFVKDLVDDEKIIFCGKEGKRNLYRAA